ncbi:hypothetical protein [Winogradskyella sp. PG-2]|uniref:hypothetical protein n=1 Tax=Winogradskyella sp. PG-2 TaxID=754409 RepID=UPI000458948B|nr:hypothetical protein [Winogradskyella sp. PG-2]BAO75954.1 hypothetical protein WPG_1724 [Winogradskyella sp. PG-2]
MKESSNDLTISEIKTDQIKIELNKSLKHLEFINQLENYIELLGESVLTVEFLKEFEESKRKA